MSQPEPDLSPDVSPGPGHGLGPRIRAHRQLRRMSLRTLAARTGTSPSFISQLERGHTGVSVANMVQIADVLGVSLGAFFDGPAHLTPAVVRRQDRPTLSTDNGVHKTLITSRPADTVEVYAGELEAGASTGGNSYTHGDSHEVFMVTRGDVELTLGPGKLRMTTGDSVEYRTSLPHGVRNVGTARAEVLWIVSPPTSSTGNSHAQPAITPVSSPDDGQP